PTQALRRARHGTSRTFPASGAGRSLPLCKAVRPACGGGSSVAHDANGSITQDGSTTYSWDGRGRLTQVVSGSTTLEFSYDCFNRRVTKTTNGVLRRYVWLGDDLAVEADNRRGADLTGVVYREHARWPAGFAPGVGQAGARE